MTFPESIATADKIIDAFDTARWVLLCAPMQSGKTSVYTIVAERMKAKGHPIFVLSGMSDNALLDQTYDRVKDVARVYFLPSLLKKIYIPGTKEPNTLSLLSEFAGSLIILDESHIGANTSSTLHKFLSYIGISPSGAVASAYYPDGDAPYILSVSATPYAERSCGNKKVVTHIPSPSYFGVDKLNLHLIEKEGKGQLEAALKEHSGKAGYAVIRSTTHTKYVREVAEASGYPVIACDMTSGELVADVVSKEPTEFTIVLLKMYARVGHTFPKKHVLMVWEVLSGADGQAQGLPGRCCGYEDASHVTVYCRNMLEDHKRWASSGYQEASLPGRGKNMVVEDGKVTASSSSMYKTDISEVPPVVKHITDPDDAIPWLYRPISLALGNVSKEDIEELRRDTLKERLQLMIVMPEMRPLGPELSERSKWELPLYTPENQADTALLLVEILTSATSSGIDGSADETSLVRAMWPYSRSFSSYLATNWKKIGIQKRADGKYAMCEDKSL